MTRYDSNCPGYGNYMAMALREDPAMASSEPQDVAPEPYPVIPDQPWAGYGKENPWLGDPDRRDDDDVELCDESDYA